MDKKEAGNYKSLHLEKRISESEKPGGDTLSINSATVIRSLFKMDERKKPNFYTQLTKHNKKLLEWIILVSICIAIAGGFTIPTIIYALNTNRGENKSLSSDFSLDSCPNTSPLNTTVQDGFVNTSESVLSLYNDKCVEYNGICAEYVKPLDSEMLLFTLTLNGISKDDVDSFVNLLKEYLPLVNKNCRDVVLPFICQYIFPPCEVSSGNVSFISKTQCTNIRDAVCTAEWNLVTRTSSSAASLLPNCENFNDDNDDNTAPIAPAESQSLQCHYQFKEYCGLCLPLCGKFSQYRVETKFQERSILIFMGAAAFIGGILVFVVSVYRQKAMYVGLSISACGVQYCMCFCIRSIFGQILFYLCTACFVLITYLGGQERLYCSDERLDIAYDNPSLFCQISGFAFHWGIVLLSVFWLLHLIHLFIKIAFPMWSRKLDRKQTKIILHVVEVTGAVFVCSLAPVLYVILSKYQFGRFPPLFCNPSKEVSFYTLCLPLCMILATGVILAVIMFWILHKRHLLFEKKKSKYLFFISFSVPEVKILILSCYFIIFGIMALTTFSISIRDADIILDSLLDYFACQAIGYSTDHTCHEEFDRLEAHLKPELNSISYFLLGLLPWFNLLFAVQVSDIKKAIQKVVHFYSSHSSQDNTFSTSNTK